MMSAAPSAPAALRSRAFLAAYALAYTGGVIGYLPLLTLLLPVKIDALGGATRLELFTVTVIAGALAASASNIAFGMLSDRSVARGRGRRGWLAGGSVATALSYAGIAVAGSPLTIVAAIIVFQVAINALLAPLMAIMADEVPDAQKGVAGGLFSLGAPVASGVSALLMAAPMLGEAGRFAAVPVLIAACTAPLLLTKTVRIDEAAVPQVASRRRDLMTAWTARLLIQVAGNVLFLYLFFYFASVSSGTTPLDLAARVSRLLFFAYLVPLPVAVLLGRWSDRSGRRKPFLLAAATTAALGLAGMAVARDWASGAAAFGVYATGSAVFLALQAGFAMQLLPNPQARGRDLGLLNLTNTLPALVGPVLAWALATPRDFSAAMLVLAALTLAGGVTILFVQGRS